MGDNDDNWWQQPEPEAKPKPEPEKPKPPQPKLPEQKPPPEPQQPGAGAPAGGDGGGGGGCGLGAARFDHQHTCPASTGDTPHVGGPIVQGSENVNTNTKQQARVTDKLKCQTEPDDVIIEGSASVLVNGWPAARRTSQTEHMPPASQIVEGSPDVNVGGPSMIIRVLPNGDLRIGKHIVVKGTKEFQQKVVRKLGVISTTKSGQQTIANIDANPKGYDLTIEEHRPGIDRDDSSVSGSGFLQKDGTPGAPSPTTLRLDPEHRMFEDYPDEATLHHEMIHADHHMWGVSRHYEATTDGWHNMEEWQTISGGVNMPGGTQIPGVPMSPTENMFTQQRGWGYYRMDHGFDRKSWDLPNPPPPPPPTGAHDTRR